MNKFANHLNGLIWTLAGTALVLITLSGPTRTQGLIISGLALALNIVGIIIADED